MFAAKSNISDSRTELVVELCLADENALSPARSSVIGQTLSTDQNDTSVPWIF